MKPPNQILLPFLILAALSFGAGQASALTVDCATAGCIGGIYDLQVSSLGGDNYTATYSVDTSVAFSVEAEFLNEIEFKVANDYSNVSVLSGPSGALADGPLSGMGCSGSNATFICLDLAPDQTVGATYTWEVQFQSTGILAESDWHIGARYTSATQEQGWLISETGGAPIPEPGAALLYGAGLLVAGVVTRKRA